MIQALKRARKLHRKAIELLYEDTCTIIETNQMANKNTHITEQQEFISYKDLPCRISFSDYSEADNATEAKLATEKRQKIVLFIAPEVQIKPGSKIRVARLGRITDYSYAGVAAIYNTHQEVILKLFERWA